eukprot:CAMPEP_0202862970 /NCGR_PEP_ID=MMETSP1391-20130828/3806_1 /ASSEMBLY_ACC=CAM_ASM_000867 /TAXON_ID=1034604 /ORGANISM="Chlamydomonas leiostraca, Strain SAG 11-49" /LENGTH=233 /DNA_ID=CAMNT_0049542565 /DNA_START=30 /DNA_END=731 /DNA_ORIENTATION=-
MQVQPLNALRWGLGQACNLLGSVSNVAVSPLLGSNKPFASMNLNKGFSASSNSPPVYPPPDASRLGTADLTDVHMPDPVDIAGGNRKVQVVQPGLFHDYGGKLRFSGQAVTIKCYENNPLVRKALGEPGAGKVLVVDGGGSLRCALLGDQLAASGVKNGWSGVIVNGCIRDSEDIGAMPLGVKALATHPLKSSKRDPGLRDVPVTFGGVTIKPGDWVYADKDGILVSSTQLSL